MRYTEECCCGRGYYDPYQYASCYECYLERRSPYLACIFCGNWHSPEYDTCYECRGIPDRDEAGRHLRLDILVRDDFRCRRCHSGACLEIDHIKPCAKGGTATPWNLQILCHDCNHANGKDWYPGCADDHTRIQLMHLYFTFGWPWLDDDERRQLRADADALGVDVVGRSPFGWHAHYQPPTHTLADTPEMQALADSENPTRKASA